MNNQPKRNNDFFDKLLQRAEQSGEILFDGQWMSAEEAQRQYRRLKADSRLKLVELIVLLALFFFGAIIPFVLLALLGGIVP